MSGVRLSDLPARIRKQLAPELAKPTPLQRRIAAEERKALEDTFARQLRRQGPHFPQPEREFRFAKEMGRDWRFDFAWPLYHVAVEIEGGTKNGGRHVRPAGFEADCEKYAEAALAGWIVLRVTADQVHDNRALRWLERALHPVAASPGGHPS